MELKGNVVVVLDVQSGTSKSGNAWRTRSFVIETGDKYPKKVCFQLFGDRVDSCPKVGDGVVVSFDVESREWNGRWFTQLNAWKVEKDGVQDSQRGGFSAPAAQNPTGNGDIPF